jgi:hypothetical protein
MKKTILLSVALLLLQTISSFAQDCKFFKDEKDPFTKEHVRATKEIRISAVPWWWIKLEQKGSQYSMTLVIFQRKEVRVNLAQGTKIMTKLEDGTVLELEAQEEAVPTFNVEQQAIIVTQWTVHISLTEKQLKKLSNSPIELIRTTIGTDECNMPKPHAKGVNRVMEYAACLLAE